MLNKNIADLKRNNKVQNQFALCYFLDYGKKNMSDNNFLSKLKEEVKTMDDKGSIITNEFAIGAIDIAGDIAKLNYKEIYSFIYDTVKEQRELERSCR